MGLMKALVPSTILTLLVAAIAGALESDAARVGFLNLENARVAGHPVYWSWPFFMTVMAINCLLVMHTAKQSRR